MKEKKRIDPCSKETNFHHNKKKARQRPYLVVKEEGESGSFAHTRLICGWILQHHFSSSLSCSCRLSLVPD
jgi:hypothetical protein